MLLDWSNHITMRGMKLPRFSLRTLILVVAFAAISCAGLMRYRTVISHTMQDWDIFLWDVCQYGPVLMPLAFLIFAAGRKKFTLALVVTFAIAEVAMIGFSYWFLYSS